MLFYTHFENCFSLGEHTQTPGKISSFSLRTEYDTIFKIFPDFDTADSTGLGYQNGFLTTFYVRVSWCTGLNETSPPVSMHQLVG